MRLQNGSEVGVEEDEVSNAETIRGLNEFNDLIVRPSQKQAIVIPLDELLRLIDEFCDFKAGDSTDGLRRLFLRGLMHWMREKEKSGGAH